MTTTCFNATWLAPMVGLWLHIVRDLVTPQCWTIYRTGLRSLRLLFFYTSSDTTLTASIAIVYVMRFELLIRIVGSTSRAKGCNTLQIIWSAFPHWLRRS